MAVMLPRIAAALLALCVSGTAQAQNLIPPAPQNVSPAVTAPVPHQFVTGYPTSGSTLSLAQPAFTDISGALLSAQCPNATTSSTGCARVGGGLSVAAGVAQVAPVNAVLHQWIDSFSSAGVAHLSQPATGDIATALNALILGTGSGLAGYAGASCTNQAISALSANGTATCSSLTNAYMASGTYSNITGTGTLTAGATGAGFTIALGASTITGALLGTNGGTGVNNGVKTLTLGGNLATTGAGAATFALTGSPATYTFPTTSGGDTIAGLKMANVFTVPQQIDVNTGAIPALPTTPVLGLANTDGNPTDLAILAAGAQPRIKFYYSGATLAPPSPPANGVLLATMTFGGFNGSAWVGGSRIAASATENWNSTSNGSQLNFESIANGSNVIQPELVLQGGAALGASGAAFGIPQGIGTMLAPNGYYVQVSGTPTQVISTTGKGIFAGGLTATLASSGAALSYACYNSSSGVFSFDASSTCLVSSLRFKHDVAPLRGALATVMELDPIEFVYDDQTNIKGPQIGLSAESAARADSRLVTYDDEGRAEKVKYLAVIGELVAAVQEQQREIASLRGAR